MAETSFNPQNLYYMLAIAAIVAGGVWRISAALNKRFQDHNEKSEARHLALTGLVKELRSYLDEQFVRKDVFSLEIRRIEAQRCNQRPPPNGTGGAHHPEN